jgi:hypothetical protein
MSNPYLSAFNSQFDEFIENILLAFPNDIDIINAKNSLLLMKKMNPKLLISAWRDYVAKPYNQSIINGGIEWFISKDYTEDMQNMPEATKILEAINRFRTPVSKLSNENKDIILKYIYNLNQLSLKYN